MALLDQFYGQLTEEDFVVYILGGKLITQGTYLILHDLATYRKLLERDS